MSDAQHAAQALIHREQLVRQLLESVTQQPSDPHADYAELLQALVQALLTELAQVCPGFGPGHD